MDIEESKKIYSKDCDGDDVLDYKKYVIFYPAMLVYTELGSMKTAEFNQVSHSWDTKYSNSTIKLYRKDLIELPILKDCIYIKSENEERLRYDYLTVQSVTKTQIGKEEYYLYILESKGPYKFISNTRLMFEKRESLIKRLQNN